MATRRKIKGNDRLRQTNEDILKRGTNDGLCLVNDSKIKGSDWLALTNKNVVK
jgi:hypothetical protein